MGKKIKLEDLSKVVLIEQLKLAWKHFRACADAISGADVQPVELLACDELGDCDDLELFYKCKKASEEIDYLNNELKNNGNGEEKKDGE